MVSMELDSVLTLSQVKKKIREYEEFVEHKLKNDLKEIETVLNQKVRKYEEWEEVKEVIQTIDEFSEKDRDMKLKVDIGNGIYAMGEITDFENTYVSIGLGYLLEMNSHEANKYSEIRKNGLKREIDHYRKLAVQVNVHIKLTLLAINELQSFLRLTKKPDKRLKNQC
ncbi:protein UXT [Aethina tumida]|uniref:protein UXT n=1 Tax=Aethina tumida TaxID=116153 RepID=UPI00096B3E5A|nr:protein UXT [Aethina tumida]